MKKLIHLAMLLSMGLAVTSLWSQTSGTKPATTTATKTEDAGAAKSPDMAQSSNVPSDYVIGADDTLHIFVWKEPDLTETLPVRPDGKISMPLLNDVPAAGMTPTQLASS